MDIKLIAESSIVYWKFELSLIIHKIWGKKKHKALAARTCCYNTYSVNLLVLAHRLVEAESGAGLLDASEGLTSVDNLMALLFLLL